MFWSVKLLNLIPNPSLPAFKPKTRFWKKWSRFGISSTSARCL